MTEKSCKHENHAINVCGLTKSFGRTKAVNGLDFFVDEGEIFSLLGINGAGKTTAVRILSGLLKPDEGEARIFGYAAGSKEVADIIGLAPQETSTAPNLTVYENLMLIAKLYGIDDPKKHAEETMESFGLTAHRDKRSKHLSGGLRRRLSLGMAVITKPRLLFLDEPTLGLDVISRRELHALIRSMREREKMTVIMTTHYMEEAEALSDRIGIMMEGRMNAAGTMDELRKTSGLPNDASLEDVFVKFREMEVTR